jgi:hypothetical protein
VFGSSRLKTRTSGEKNVEEERQVAMLPQPPVIGDVPKVARLYRELKNEWVLSRFDIDARSIVWRWKNLHPGTLPPPRTWHEEATEAIFTSYLQRPSKDRLLDVLANSLPLGSIERRTGFYRDDLFVAKGEADSAG